MIWPMDNTPAKIAFYGDFQKPGWQAANLVRFKPPFTMYYGGKPMTSGLLVHRKIVPALTTIFANIWDKCDHSLTKVRAAGADTTGGVFNIRKIAGNNNWSNHSWACAIDLSPDTNGFRYNASTTLSRVVIDAFKAEGALWGGDYTGRKDPMHFEFVRRH